MGQHISQKANDKQEVEAALESIKFSTDKLPEKISLDNGYMSGQNLKALEGSQTDYYIAINKGEKKPRKTKVNIGPRE